MNFKKNIPNAVSLTRILFAIFLVLFAINDEWKLAFWFLIAGILTDVLDGFLARKLDAKSEIGEKWIDPICDMVLTFFTVAGLVFTGIISWIAVFILLVMAACLWVPIHRFKPDNSLRLRCEGINPPFNILVMFVCYLMYLYKAYAEYWYTGVTITIITALVVTYIKWPHQLIWWNLIIGKRKKNRLLD